MAKHEPRDPGHQGPDRAGGQLPQRPPSRTSSADYILANPPFNVSDWGGERLAGRPALAVYGVAAGGQRELRLGAALPAPPRPLRAPSASSSPTARCLRTSRARGEIRKRHRRGRSRGLHRRPARTALPLHPEYPACLWFLVQGTAAPASYRDRERRGAVHRRPRDGPHDRPHAPRTDR